jgi:cation transport regulator ChaC
VPEEHEVARLYGFDICIRPLANLVRCEQGCVYGIVATATHEELERLYEHAEYVLGGVYVPEAVLAETTDGKLRPALCYRAPAMEPKPASNDYVDRIVAPAKEYGFPAWYIERLERFRPV